MALTQVDQGLLSSTAQYTGFKSRIINGGMTIDQRNAGASVTPSATGAVYTLDRWYLFSLPAASKFSVRQVAAPAGFTGFTNAALITTASAIAGTAADVYAFDQAIEGYNIADLKWGAAGAQTITLSFWAQASITGTYAVCILASGGNATYATTVSLTANTATYCSITVPGPTIGTYGTTNNAGFYVIFDMGSGSNYDTPTPNAWAAGNYGTVAGTVKLVRNAGATFYLSGVQLEKGSTATSFDYRPYGTEMSLCQRYYWRMGGAQFGGAFMPMVLFTGISTTSLAGNIQLPVRVRTPPTSITLGGTAPSISGGTITTNLTLDRNSYDSTMVYISGTGFAAGTSYRWIGSSDATTFLGFEGMEL